jgi:hypothetical protein
MKKGGTLFPVTGSRAMAWICGVLLGFCFVPTGWATDLYVPVTRTPFDRQMARVAHIIEDQPNAGSFTLDDAHQLVNRLNRLPYRYANIWMTPEETLTSGSGDCKNKSLILIQQMKDQGARNVKLVIGTHKNGPRNNHAWVKWILNGETWILDPTHHRRAFRAAQFGRGVYEAGYAYSESGRYQSVRDAAMVANR